MSNQLALPGLLGEADEWIWRDDFDEVTDVKRFEHATVMREEVVRAIAPRPGGVYVDATLGGGGHVVALLEVEPKARIVAFDRDPVAIEAARERLATVADRVTLVHGAFSSVREHLDGLGIDRVDGLTKLIIEPETERILGVGLAGSGAGELIAEGVLAIEMAATATDLKLTIHPHPTLTETLMESAEVFFGQATHVYRPKRG